MDDRENEIRRLAAKFVLADERGDLTARRQATKEIINLLFIPKHERKNNSS